MEKFAVDLEKVLDEFEYNEEREENVSAPSIRNPPLPSLGIGALRQAPAVRPPAASYRRPSFEPINLADADFAASPPKPSTVNFSLGAPVTVAKQKEDETLGYVSNKTQLNNRNYVNADNTLVSALNKEANIRNQFISESEKDTSKVWPNRDSSMTNDEKPDLLEYNSKNIDYETSNLEHHNQLPDVTTSVRTIGHDPNSNGEETVPNSLDLILSTSGHLSIENEEITSNGGFECEGEKFAGDEPSETNYQTPNHSFETCVVPNQEENNDITILENIHSQDNSYEHSSISLNLSGGKIINNVCEKAILNVTTHPDMEVNNQAQSLSDKIFVPNEEKLVEEKLETYDCKRCESQSDGLVPVQPIGFTNDSDVSDGELEEYLKELEEMDESLDLKEKTLPGVEEVKVEIGESSSYKSLTETIASIDNEHSSKVINLGCQIQSHKSVEFSNRSESKIEGNVHEMCPKNAQTNLDSSEPHNFSGKTSTIENIKNTSVKSEPSFCEVDCHNPKPSSMPEIACEDIQKNQDQVMSISHDTTESDEIVIKMEGTTLSVKEDCKIDSIKRPVNPFCNTNPFECIDENKKEESRKVESTNPFDDEDSGYISEKMESKRKSTNPFEDDDEDVSVDNSILETPPVCTTADTFSTKSTTVVPKSVSENSEEDKVKSASFKSDVLVSNTDNPHTDKHSNERTEILSAETVSKTQPIDEHANYEISAVKENVINESHANSNISAVEENAINESLPGCSNAHQETMLKTSRSSAKMIPIKAAVESPSAEHVDEAGVPAEEDRPLRPSSLELPQKITVEASVPQSPPPQSPPQSPNAGQLAREFGPEDRRLGRIPPFWVPDTDATSCMQCQQKFTVIKRRHHCRACGQVLCYKCCDLKARLEYMNFTEARVCHPCFTILEALNASEASSPLGRQPNPNNPMEYCSTIPPLQQAAGTLHQPPPSVMVPVGVLKREGRMKSEVTKQVMFSDGIRPGGDLTELDGSSEPRMPFRRPGRLTKRVGTPPGGVMSPAMRRVLDPATHSFIPADGDGSLPPVVSRVQGEVTFSDLETPIALNQPTLKFALNRNLFVIVKRVMLDCCVNRECWCFSTEGLACVGQDEIVFLLECLPEEARPPKDIFLLINYLYQEAAKGSTVSEMSFTPATSNNLLGSKDHGGFLYIRTSYQCTAQLVLPSPPYLVALLIHRWETPWARLFPLRLVLRLGAEFRYYPCPLVSVRNRPPLYNDIGHTIINILADFRKYSYTLPSVRGLVIHMEDRQTTINIPRNRYDQVVRALNNSNDSVLAFGANLSLAADSHLVCMQSSEDDAAYTTQAINIHNKPRRVTGASFVVFNGALKVPGLAGKSSIVEDGLMVQVPSETMTALRTALRDMRDYTVGCGPNAEETVALQWTADDTNFNIGVKSCIDGRSLDGVPSIRVHNGTDYSGGTRIIRWTEVFILQCEDSEHSGEPLDISRLSESIARATCLALVPLLDLLSAASFSTLAVRTTIHPDNVGYEAGSNGEKLPPLYMKSLDEELIAVVHQAALASQDTPCVLELVFRIMEQG